MWFHLPLSAKDQQSMRQACWDQILCKVFQQLHWETVFGTILQPHAPWPVLVVLLPSLPRSTRESRRGNTPLTPVLHPGLFLDTDFRWCHSSWGFPSFHHFPFCSMKVWLRLLQNPFLKNLQLLRRGELAGGGSVLRICVSDN